MAEIQEKVGEKMAKIEKKIVGKTVKNPKNFKILNIPIIHKILGGKI